VYSKWKAPLEDRVIVPNRNKLGCRFFCQNRRGDFG